MSINQYLNGLNPLSYMGVNARSPVNLTVRNQDPTTTDVKNFERGALWLNPDNNRMFQLISLVGNIAQWSGITYFVSRAVDPTGGDANYALGTLWLNTVTKNVFMLIATTGTPPTAGTWVLFMDATGPLLQLTTDDSSIVLPSAGNINLHGTNNITTTGSGSTATISLAGTTNHTLQVGNASAGLTSLTAATNGQIPIGSTGANPVIAAITAGTGIGVANGAGSITVSITGTGVVSTLTGNTGGAISPVANNINLVGSGNISVAGSGNTLTITETQTPLLNNYTLVNTTPYVVLSTDYYLGVDCSGGAIVMNLPNAPTANRTFIVKDITGSAATHNITVTTVGGAVTIDGSTTFVMNTNYESANLTFVSPSYQIY
jgi:hypothetical protein